MEKYDVVIIGAGPAGLKCAEILAKNNKKVLVLEKNKNIGKKVCAGGLTMKDFELGIPDKIIQKLSSGLDRHSGDSFLPGAGLPRFPGGGLRAEIRLPRPRQAVFRIVGPGSTAPAP